ncbi:MAG TPA: HNH endonuclease signature motif containing protein [Burkholderiaceae bacterium]
MVVPNQAFEPTCVGKPLLSFNVRPNEYKQDMPKPPIEVAYEIAKLVYQGSLAQGAGAKQLEADNGFNINSARDLIMVFRHLMQGESFQRGLSAPDMDYFLSRIGADYGPASLRTAVQALWLHLRYYEGIRKVTMRKLRGVAAAHQALAAVPESLVEMEANFKLAVQRSLAGSPDQRQQRLQAAPKLPKRTPVVLFAFERNPDVVAEALFRAEGQCGRCEADAPFLRRKDRTPYLEVHHVIQLSEGGEDTIENAIALCPNCHRELHYGAASEV